MQAKIVKMEDRHITAIAELEKICFSQPWNEEQLREELSNECAFYFVAEIESETVGYIGCHMILDEGYITNVAVDNGYRQSGIGNSLVAHMTDTAKEYGLSFLTLEARVSNKNAINLYDKNGYKTVGIRRNFYNTPVEDAVLMTLFLKKDEH